MYVYLDRGRKRTFRHVKKEKNMGLNAPLTDAYDDSLEIHEERSDRKHTQILGKFQYVGVTSLLRDLL